jgi:hypothetical protein
VRPFNPAELSGEMTLRKLPIAIGVALAFDLGTFVAASSAAGSDYLLKIKEPPSEDGPRACSTKAECDAANAPEINASGCALIGGVQVQIDGARMCKVTPPKPQKPRGGLSISVPLPGSSSSGSSQPPVR